jgi:hypothetical protein
VFIRTWMIESFTVMVILIIAMTFHPFSWAEFICGLAVWLSFMHAQVSNRMEEKQAKLIKPDVDCYRWSARYFILKELLWIFFFLLSKSYSAITGSVVFFLYLFWRRYYNMRKDKALTSTPPD